MNQEFSIAAIVPPEGGEADSLLRAFAADLVARGLRVRGVVQTSTLCAGSCQVTLLDVADGTAYPISQNLGAASVSCSLDPGALAGVSGVFRRAAEEGADLVIFNRFGNTEAEGGGLVDEMLEVMSRGLRVLTIVQPKNQAAWQKFTGGLASLLPAERQALDAWFAQLGG